MNFTFQLDGSDLISSNITSPTRQASETGPESPTKDVTKHRNQPSTTSNVAVNVPIQTPNTLPRDTRMTSPTPNTNGLQSSKRKRSASDPEPSTSGLSKNNRTDSNPQPSTSGLPKKKRDATSPQSSTSGLQNDQVEQPQQNDKTKKVQRYKQLLPFVEIPFKVLFKVKNYGNLK